MKILAYFLPQFHEDEKNNIWWGKGFTEWVNLKKSKKLYIGHEQPKLPLKYYDLTDREVMKWHAKLLKKYKVYGLCYYHYWSLGEKILSKPVENLLNWKEIEQNYCFFWANHDWRKDWVGDSKTILFNQQYGEEKDWEIHFEYLKQFFLDERYIKVNNKPLFIIYNKKVIKNFEKIKDFFNRKCIEIGFSGIEILISISNVDELSKNKENIIIREPDCSLYFKNIFEKIYSRLKKTYKIMKIFPVQRMDYERFLSKGYEIATKNIKNNVYPTLFTGWDNTPRYGKSGFVLENNNIKTFRKYLLKYKKLMKEKNSEYLFINAWNEWTEGMYLEPDQKNRYKYLEVIKEVMDTDIWEE